MVLNDASLNLCSLACVNADGFNCNSFEFCPLTKTCLLNSGNQQVTKNPNATVPTDNCSHYKSKLFLISPNLSLKDLDNIFCFLFLILKENIISQQASTLITIKNLMITQKVRANLKAFILM